MKFILSYSCGKDSTLVLHKMIEEGHEPIGLLVTVNKEAQRSWFHGVDLELLAAISDSLGIPLILCETVGDEYNLSVEECLRIAKEKGAEACAFGDIDIDEHAEWCNARCDAVGIKSIFPLWKRDRRENTMEAISLGYNCIIKCIRNDVLPQSILGKPLDLDMVNMMEKNNLDVCGENGEYHTVVLGGPIFHKEIKYQCKEIIDLGNTSAINVILQEK